MGFGFSPSGDSLDTADAAVDAGTLTARLGDAALDWEKRVNPTVDDRAGGWPGDDTADGDTAVPDAFCASISLLSCEKVAAC